MVTTLHTCSCIKSLYCDTMLSCSFKLANCFLLSSRLLFGDNDFKISSEKRQAIIQSCSLQNWTLKYYYLVFGNKNVHFSIYSRQKLPFVKMHVQFNLTVITLFTRFSWADYQAHITHQVNQMTMNMNCI